jgi:hypothetical protein
MEKVIQSDDVNSKINAIMDIFVNMNLTIQDFAMTDSLRKYCKEK